MRKTLITLTLTLLFSTLLSAETYTKRVSSIPKEIEIKKDINLNNFYYIEIKSNNKYHYFLQNKNTNRFIKLNETFK